MNTDVDTTDNETATETVTEEPVARKPRKKKKKLLFLAVAATLIAALALLARQMQSPGTRAVQPVSHEPTMEVSVVHPKRVPATIPLELPGHTKAYTDAPIFAQTSGYLKAWHFDIGARVKAGEVLAEIDTPEVDQELAQAQAQLKVAQAQLQLARVTFQRQQDLFNRKVIAAEDYDIAKDTYHENQATLAAGEANVDRLEALEAFKVIRAPFDGIVTARNVDIGDYVAAGSGNQLFSEARVSPLRVYIRVPQAFTPLVKPGAEGDLTLNEFPGRTFQARVTNASVAIDPVSRAALVELQYPNESGELLPGAYAQVTLKLTGQTGLYTLPANAMLFRKNGASVGVVHPDGKVEIRKINITLNDGNTLQIAGRLFETDQVIINPTDSLADGMRVNVLRPKQPASAPSSASNG
jgi:RND family efflux transporter MFP subunit